MSPDAARVFDIFGPTPGNEILSWAKTEFENLETVTSMPPLPVGLFYLRIAFMTIF